jgi:ribosome-associated translation inhibitor RaiA
MNFTMQKDDIKLHPIAQRLIDRKTDKLKSLLVHYNDDMLDLKLNLEMIEPKNIYIANIFLAVPNQTFKIEKNSKDLTEALGQAFDALIREVKRFKEKLRKTHTYKEHTKK